MLDKETAYRNMLDEETVYGYMLDKETAYGYMLDKETGSECQECPELIQTCPSTEC